MRLGSPLSLRPLLAALSCAAAAATLLSCTSSGDGGMGGTDEFLDRGAEVAPDSPAPRPAPLEYVDFAKISGDRDSACIAVEAHRTANVFAAAFTVTYDPSMLTYVSFNDGGTCLGSGGDVLPTLVDATTPGQLIVGLTRNAANTSTGVNCGRILELCFDVAGEGDTRMTFSGNRELLDPAGAPLDVQWLGADVQTRL